MFITRSHSRRTLTTQPTTLSARLIMSVIPLTRRDPEDLFRELQTLLEEAAVTPVFQPIVDLRRGELLGYEGLIRGPQHSPLASPAKLFQVAAQFGLLLELEALCRRVILSRFVAQSLPGRLFLNTTPDCLLSIRFSCDALREELDQAGLPPERLVIELTESRPIDDVGRLLKNLAPCRAAGMGVALDDLGAGFAGLRVWYELQPDFVKVDMHFVQEIDRAPLKRYFTQAVQQLTVNSGAQLIAEGIESHAELRVLQEMGVAFGQGYFIAKPMAEPAVAPSADVVSTIRREAGERQWRAVRSSHAVARALLREVTPVEPGTLSETVYRQFAAEPELMALPVVDSGRPVGLLERQVLLELFAAPFKRDLYGRKPCAVLMDAFPLQVEAGMDLTTVSRLVLDGGRNQMGKGFVITDGGRYLGMGSAFDLMRLMTEHRVTEARYANPLTQLPGNVPIDERVDGLLDAGDHFVAAYADLDNFKPFNDVYGYRKGDDLIKLTARILYEACHPERDFLGHIGGDDFVMLFRSEDWARRCQQALRRFDAEAHWLFSPEHRAAGGFVAADRYGRETQLVLTTLSIGAIEVRPGLFASHHEIAAAAAEAKKRAKEQEGSLLVTLETPLQLDQHQA